MFFASRTCGAAIALGLAAASVAAFAGISVREAHGAARTLEASCDALAGTDRRLRAVVSTAATLASCRVSGELRPVAGSRIGVALWLPPAAAWSGRLVMLGNGGYSSRLPLPQMAAELARGSAVVATDTGHQGDDPDFARGRPEAIVDWGWRAMHLSAVAARTLATRFYGRAPHHRYFNGCSTGGHQALM